MRRAVGIFFFLGLILLGALTFWVDKEISLFRHGESFYYIRLDNAAGLQEGARVWLAGVDAGRITKIALLPDQVGIRAEFIIFKPYRLRGDSQASLPPTSLLANGRMLELSLGSPASPYLPIESEPPGVEVKYVKPPVALEQVVEKADQLFAGLKDAGPAIREAAESVRNISRKIEKGEGTLGKFINDPKLYDDLRAAVGKLDEGLASFKSIAAKFDKGEGTLAKLLNDPKMYEELTGTMGKLNQGVESFKNIAAKIEKGEGTLGKLFADEALYNDLREASKGLAELSRKLSSGEGTLGRLVNDPAVYDEIKRAAGSLAAVMQKIEKGEGTLGKLVADESLYVEARRLLKEAREAVEDAREQAPITAFSSVIFAAFQ